MSAHPNVFARLKDGGEKRRVWDKADVWSVENTLQNGESEFVFLQRSQVYNNKQVISNLKTLAVTILLVTSIV